MANFTFEIKNCKIFGYDGKQNKAWGKLVWLDGTIDFEQKFQTTYQDVIAFIEANRNAEVEFKVSGYMTKNEGYGDHKGKFFNNWIVDKIEIAGMEKMDVQELVKKVFDIPENEGDDEIPF